MEELTIEDIKLVTNTARTVVREPERSDLKKVYSKLEFICQNLPNDKFNYKIRKDPRNQGGGFKYFQDYLWAKIFPKEFESDVWNKLAIILGIANDTLHLHIMGIGEYQDMEASKITSKSSWEEINLSNLQYETISKKIEDFYLKNRNLFIDTADKLGLKKFKKIKAQLEMQKKLDLLTYKKQIILQGPPGTGKTREAEIIATEMLGLSEIKELENNDQYKLVQFHPSYTYEDFVRGIIAVPSGNSVIYESTNKILGKFAKDALNNYTNSKKSPELISKESWVAEKYELFKDSLRSILEESSEVLIKSGIKPKIIAVEDDSLRVNRYSNENDSILVKDNDIVLAYIGLELSPELIKIRENINLSKSARSGMSYVYQNLVTKFKDFLIQNSYNYIPSLDLKTEQLRKYIFIIDEINRANLSSVLGELIYAM